ncbi:MAG: C25 family cysteine peptidase [Anaerolineae bacterium]
MGFKRKTLRAMLVLVLLVGPAVASPGAAVPAAADEQALSVVPVDGGLALSLRAPEPTLAAREVDGKAYTDVSAAGFLATGAAGAPALPSISLWVVVPPATEPSLAVISATDETVTLAAPPLPSPSWRATEGDAAGASLFYSEDAARYEATGLYPDDLCSITADSWVREWRLVQIACHPYRYDGQASALVVTREANLQLSYGVTSPAVTDLSAAAAAAGDALAVVVANPEDLGRYRQAQQPPLSAAAVALVVGRYRLTVGAGDGLYAVTYEQLLGAGVPITGVASSTLRLYLSGVEVAIQVEDADGTFGPGDRFVFYGQERQSPYGTDNAYWLDWGGIAGLRVTGRALAGAGGAGAVHLLATAKMRSYDPRYSDPWRGTWTDLFLYEILHSDIADDGHFYAGSVQVRSAADMPDTEWFAVEVPGAAGEAGTLQLTFESLTPGNHIVGAQFGVISRGGSFVSYLPGVLRSRSASAAANTVVVAQAAEPAYTSLGTITWTGSGAKPYQLSVPSGTGLHVLKLTQAGQSDGAGGYLPERAYVPTPLLKYPLAYAQGGAAVGEGRSGSANYTLGGIHTAAVHLWDVSNPLAPVVLSGYGTSAQGGQWHLTFSDNTPQAATYAVADGVGLKGVSGITAGAPVDPLLQAQYLIVCHEDFVAAAQALAAYRQSKGLTTRVVTTQAIYDRYSYGLLDPEAIRSFVYGYAYPNWVSGGSHTLRYLLLMGDGSYDFENRLNHGLANYVPPYLAEDLDPNRPGEAGADHLFANARYTVPSVYVGRMPVRTAAQAIAMVNKVMAYEASDGSAWSGKGLFAADDPDTSTPTGFDFVEVANAAISGATGAGVLSGSGVTRVFQSASANPPAGYYYSQGDGDTAALLAAWRAGQGVAYYSGHSHFWGWASPKLIESDDLAALVGSPASILLSMTCFTGAFYIPTQASLDEALLLVSNGGTIGSISPMSMGSVAGHRQMQGPLLERVFGRATLGEVLLAGKMALDSSYRDLVDTYGILGDPALRLVGTAAGDEYSVLLPVVAEALSN